MVKDITKESKEGLEKVLVDIITDIDEDADFENLDYNAPLRDQLDLDSMDFLDIVMELRKNYGMNIPEDEYPQLNTMNSSIDYLSKFKYQSK